MKTCKSCNSEITGNFCSNCGRKTVVKRIDGTYILHEIGSVLNFEKGILFTIKELTINPGKSIKTFIAEDRNRLVKPIIFLIITSLIYTILSQFFKIEDGYVNFESTTESAITAIFNWVQNNYGYANIIMGIFIVLWLKVFFRKYHYNFFELLILLCFVMGMGMLIYALFGILEGITSIKLMQISGIIGIIYCTWSIGQFFDKRKKMSYLKAFIAYFLGMFTFSILAVALGLFIDFIVVK